MRRPGMTYPVPEPRVTAWWYAQRARLAENPCEPGDREFLAELGLRAARLARWEGLVPLHVPEGPFRVHAWPERIWRAAADAAGHGPEDAAVPATRVVHCQREPYDVYIGRPGPLGNPFEIGRDGTRRQVIAAYGRYLASRPDLLAMLPALRGRVLGCWCAPRSCHGHVLARRADAAALPAAAVAWPA
jgi:hypothetical protein